MPNQAKHQFPWVLIKDAFSGKSVVDTRYMTIRSLSDAEQTITYYGYDWESQNDRVMLLQNFRKALDFIQVNFVDPFPESLKIPDELRRCEDLRQVLLWTNPRARNRDLHLWSCASLKVLHTILHLENDPLFDYFPEARRQIFQRFHGHVYIDEQQKIYFGRDSQSFIPLYFFEVKREKDWNSKLIKLLHKPENTAARIFDHIGVRVVTEDLVDVLMVYQYLLSSKIFIFANITPSRSRNTLVDLNKAQKKINQIIRRYKKKEIDDGALEKEIASISRSELLLQNPKHEENQFSLGGFRSIQFTCRHLVRFPNPTYMKLMDLRQHMFVDHVPLHTIQELDQILADVQREICFFFPFEIQIMDRVTFLQNQEGFGSHAEYKQNQLHAARKRVLGKILEPIKRSN